MDFLKDKIIQYDLESKIIKFFKDKGVDEYESKARVIAENILKGKIYDKDKVLSKEQTKSLKDCLKKVLSGMPISKIYSYKFFWEEKFYVNRYVLDPRPDSEIIIESIIKDYGDLNLPLFIIDLGTGSGCLFITVLTIYKNSVAIAVDKSQKAINVAKQNAEKILGQNNRYKILKSNWFENVTGKFDVIISNPPYIKKGDLRDLNSKGRLIYEPKIALDGGEDGLAHYKKILCEAKDYLNQNGRIYFEIGFDQKNSVIAIGQQYGLKFLYSKKDLAGNDRLVVFENKS